MSNSSLGNIYLSIRLYNVNVNILEQISQFLAKKKVHHFPHQTNQNPAIQVICFSRPSSIFRKGSTLTFNFNVKVPLHQKNQKHYRHSELFGRFQPRSIKNGHSAISRRRICRRVRAIADLAVFKSTKNEPRKLDSQGLTKSIQHDIIKKEHSGKSTAKLAPPAVSLA